MRHHDLGVVTTFVTHEQHVDVEGSRTPSNLADSSARLLGRDGRETSSSRALASVVSSMTMFQ